MSKKTVTIKVEPDKRYSPICHKCKSTTNEIQSYNQRTVRDLNIFDAKTYLSVSYRTVKNHCCGNGVEELAIMNLYE